MLSTGPKQSWPTSSVKSTWPGVSMMLMRCLFQVQVVAALVMVMPRSCSQVSWDGKATEVGLKWGLLYPRGCHQLEWRLASALLDVQVVAALAGLAAAGHRTCGSCRKVVAVVLLWASHTLPRQRHACCGRYLCPALWLLHRWCKKLLQGLVKMAAASGLLSDCSVAASLG